MKPTPWKDTWEDTCDCQACQTWEMYHTEPSMVESACTLLGAIGIALFLIFICSCAHPKEAHAEVFTDKTAILALIGEAEDQSQTCKIAIGEVLRRRGSLQGVYGIHAKRVLTHKYSSQVALLARAAWFDSRFTNYSRGAQGWGNSQDLIKFRQCKWFKNCEIVAHIDGTYFWKRRA